MANRPRTRSWSQSEDDSDTPSLTHGQRMTRSSKRGKVLETVVASPEPEPAKKLSFTPAQTPITTTRQSANKRTESEKKKVTKPKTPKAKQSEVVLVPIPDDPQSPLKSEKKKKSAVKKHQVDETVESTAVKEKIATSKKKSQKEESVLESPIAEISRSIKSSNKKKQNPVNEKEDNAEESVTNSPPPVIPTMPKSSKRKKSVLKPTNEINEKGGEIKEPQESSKKKKSAHKRKRHSENGQLKELIDGKLLETGEKNRWQLKVHRCRFVGWMPDPIHTLLALPAHLNGNMVAVSRAGGDLELVNVDERWSVTSRVHGPAAETQAAQDGSGDVRALAWVMGGPGVSDIKGVSLIGATLSGVLFEADFRTGLRRRERDSMGGSVWALASPPHCTEQSPMSNVVAAGCEDGTVRLFQLGEDEGVSGGLELVRTLGPVGSRVTSLAWARSASGGVGHLYAGTSDGTIHRLDPKTGRNEGRMTLERRGSATGSGRAAGKGEGGDDSVVVWALKALSDGTVVSGDSAGFVQFWDGLNCAFSSRVETHTADVLCLAVSDDEKCVFASGMDHKVVCLRRLSAMHATSSNNSDNSGHGVWSLAHAYRAHQLDVRALAIVHLSKSTAPEHNAVGPWNPHKSHKDGSTNMAHREILVSAGLDTKLCTYHVRNFTEHRPKRIWPFPYHAVVSISAPKRLLLAQHRDKLELWQLPPKVPQQLSLEPQQVSHRLLCELKLNKEGGSALVCSAVSNNGVFLAASDAKELRLFRLVASNTADKISSVTVQKLPLTKEAMKSAQLLCFTEKRLISASRDGSIRVITLPNSNEKKNKTKIVDVEHCFRFCDDVNKEEGENEDQLLGLPFTSLKVSGDGAWLAAAGTMNHVIVYSLDSMSLHWKLPTCTSRVTSLAFPHAATNRHGDNNSLVLASVDNRIHVYDVEKRRLGDWSVY